MVVDVVVGLGFGDEGKGRVIQELLKDRPPTMSAVVRFSGGPQAGHTVFHNGKKHVFSNFGCGALHGLPSIFTKHTCVYPITAVNEAQILGFFPKLYVAPNAKLITPYDVAYNKFKEQTVVKHGSCGLGIGATMKRSKLYSLDVQDLWCKPILDAKLNEIKRYYESITTNEYKLFDKYCELEMEHWEPAVKQFVDNVELGIDWQRYYWLIFEGSQGLLLDKKYGIFPNVTYANTSIKNAMSICKKLPKADVTLNYVTRSYLTRHGNGWVPQTPPVIPINNHHEINTPNEWQGSLRCMGLDYRVLNYSIARNDAFSLPVHKRHLWVTCCDQTPLFKLDQTLLPTFDSIKLLNNADGNATN